MGERIRCVIKSVEKAGKNAGVIVSRAAPELVVRLFEQEVPEIYDGTVVVKGCAREAGERTKIAVLSRDRDVDCVGACVGMKGMRVQSIIRELRGEKIDIIEYSDDPALFATHALSPAKISRVSILSGMDKHMEVVVDDTQLSLAIGKKGQNVRLAAKLLGWKIDIKSEEEKRQEVESQIAALTVQGAPVSVLIDHGLSEGTVQRLVDGGIGTVEKLGNMTPEELEQVPGVSEDNIESIRDAVMSYYGQFEGEYEAGQEGESQTAEEGERPLYIEADNEASDQNVGNDEGGYVASTASEYEIPTEIEGEPSTAPPKGEAAGDDYTPGPHGPAETEENAPTFGDDGGSLDAPTKSDPESEEDSKPLVPPTANEPV
jgi:N utilization substance protein A